MLTIPKVLTSIPDPASPLTPLNKRISVRGERGEGGQSRVSADLRAYVTRGKGRGGERERGRTRFCLLRRTEERQSDRATGGQKREREGEREFVSGPFLPPPSSSSSFPWKDTEKQRHVPRKEKQKNGSFARF